ncbi:MAG: hypothetical protein IJU32_00620 [Pyramidobacter sp.]|nr:hypothetical protein [Pyramidobacter sp.]
MKRSPYLIIAAFLLFCLSGWLGLFRELDVRGFGRLERRQPALLPQMPTLRMLGNRGDMQFYANAWDAYLSDRVLGRSLAVATYLRMGLTLAPAVQDSAYVEGKDGWLFLGNGHYSRDMIDYTRNVYPASEAQVTAKCEYLRSLRETAREIGARFAVLVAPNKSSVYPEFLPDWLTIRDHRRFADRVCEKLQAEGFPIVFPKKLLEGTKKRGQLFFKDDSHWNEVAALPSFAAVMELLSAQGEKLRSIALKKVKAASGKKKWAGDIVVTGNLDRSRMDSRIWYCTYPEKKNLKRVKVRTEKGPFGEELTIAENPAALNPEHLLIIGDSFAGYFFGCARVSFARVTSIHTATLKNADLKDVLLRIRPDCVIFENVERYFWKP